MDKKIRRDYYLQKLVDRRMNGAVKVITGIRRCGKSYLLFELFKNYLLKSGVKNDRIIAISLDDDESIKFRDPDYLSKFVRSKVKGRGHYYIFLDEVQYAISKSELRNPDEIRLYNVLNGLLRMGNIDIYVTGSNSKLLSKDVMTAFRGRGDQVRMFPLTFKEYFDFVGGEISNAYEEYVYFGGMPYLTTIKAEEDKRRYLKDLFDLVYYKDIMERYDIKFPDVLQNLSSDLCSSVGSLTNASKISRALKSVNQTCISSTTVSRYLDFLTESFLFSEAKRYDVKGKRYFDYPSKFYCTDIGLRNAQLGYRQQEESHAMENIIYNELISRGYSVDVGVIELEEKNSGQRMRKQCEIDFVVNKTNKRYYIQSALTVASEEKMNQELRPLKHTNDFFKKIIVTKTASRPWVDEFGIEHIGVYDFLLNKDSLDLLT